MGSLLNSSIPNLVTVQASVSISVNFWHLQSRVLHFSHA